MPSATSVDWEQVKGSLLGKRNQQLLPPWVKLPTLPSALMQCVRKAQDPNIGAADLGKIIERDAALTCILMRRVNSAASGMRDPVHSASEAVVRLGIRGTILFLVTNAVNEVMKASKSKLVDIRGFWCANLERAIFSRQVARLLKTDDELAFASAILADCLLPLLTTRASMTYLRFLKLPETQKAFLPEFETGEFGWDHGTATALLLDGWNFPPDLVCCVQAHHRGIETLADSELQGSPAVPVALSGLLPDQLRQSPGGVKQLRELESTWPQFNLDELAEAVEREFEEIAPEAQNPFPLTRRIERAR